MSTLSEGCDKEARTEISGAGKGHRGGEGIAQVRVPRRPGAGKADLPPVVMLKRDSGGRGSATGRLHSMALDAPRSSPGKWASVPYMVSPDTMLPTMVLGLLKQ